MSTFRSGNGGGIVVGTSTQVVINRWTLRKTSKLTENTHSGVTATNFEHVVPHYEWEVEVPFDEDNIPDGAAGLVEGAKVVVKFKIGGGSAKFDILTGTSVERLEEVDDNSEDIVRVRVSGKGGTLTRAT